MYCTVGVGGLGGDLIMEQLGNRLRALLELEWLIWEGAADGQSMAH